MACTRLTSRKLKRVKAKTIGRAPVWLKTVCIATRHPEKPIRGTFGAASPCVSIDPATGRPREDAA